MINVKRSKINTIGEKIIGSYVYHGKAIYVV